MSKIYIWEDVGPVTHEYHDGGGVVIVTARDPREVWREHAATTVDVIGVPLGNTALDSQEPNVVIPIRDDAQERVIVFRDAGCC